MNQIWKIQFQNIQKTKVDFDQSFPRACLTGWKRALWHVLLHDAGINVIASLKPVFIPLKPPTTRAFMSQLRKGITPLFTT